jgi:hypothetical protein
MEADVLRYGGGMEKGKIGRETIRIIKATGLASARAKGQAFGHRLCPKSKKSGHSYSGLWRFVQFQGCWLVRKAKQGADRFSKYGQFTLFKVNCVAASRHTNSYFILSSFCGLKYFYKKSVHRYFWGISETISFTILWFLLSCFDLVLFQKAPKQRVKHRDSRKHTI